jgi:hypothetical protein
MSDEILVDVDEPATTIRMHPPDEHPALRGRELPTGVVGDMLGVRHVEFR